MGVKNLLVRLAEKITGRKCCRCMHNEGGICKHPYEGAFSKCWQSLTRPGFVHSESVANATNHQRTLEEERQLQKIKGVLDQAEETARDGGLLGEERRLTTSGPVREALDAAATNPDPAQAPLWPRRNPYLYDDKTESGLLED